MSGILFKSLQDSLKSLNSTNHNHNAILNNCANLKKNKVSKIILEMFYFFCSKYICFIWFNFKTPQFTNNIFWRYPEMARSTENKNLVIRDVCRYTSTMFICKFSKFLLLQKTEFVAQTPIFPSLYLSNLIM